MYHSSVRHHGRSWVPCMKTDDFYSVLILDMHLNSYTTFILIKNNAGMQVKIDKRPLKSICNSQQKLALSNESSRLSYAVWFIGCRSPKSLRSVGANSSSF